MGYRFYTCDVFTDTRFGGNPLAVLPEAAGLSDRQMQEIAKEFNFSESAFVLPPERGQACRVRIFTPTGELPFAGHPNVGTAFVLATIGRFGPIEDSVTVTFEEKAGLVPIEIRRVGTGFHCELSAPERLSLGETVSPGAVAAAVSLAAGDIVTTTHPPQPASVGVPFICVELRDRSALGRARLNAQAYDAVAPQPTSGILLYTAGSDGFDLRARMFGPLEDPATGSANCALAGLLSHYGAAADGTRSWRIAQGVEMGRPSVLEASAEKHGGEVVATRVGGASVMVSEGMIDAG